MKGKVIRGDCRTVMTDMIEEGVQQFDFVFADPPFNIGQNYDGCTDSLANKDYAAWTDDWFALAWAIVKSDCLLAVHCPDTLARHLLRYDHPDLLHWINWHYRFGQAKSASSARSCINSREHLLVFGLADRKPTFNPPMVASDRSTKYNDSRTNTTSTPGQRVAFNIWGLPEDGDCWGRVQGNNAERWDKKHGALLDHPNQLPENYVARIIETFTNPGDRILIPFAGSGTEMVVGAALGRKMAGIEISEMGCGSIKKRMLRGAVRETATTSGRP